MITTPIPVSKALESQRIKRLLPTNAGSLDLAKLAPEIRERSIFSARTAMVEHLDAIQRSTMDLIAGETGPASVRLQLKQSLASLSYDPVKAGVIPGSLQDLSSDARTNLIIDMQEKFAHGYAQHEADQDPTLLDLWPCWELVRHESRKKERLDWPSRFVAAGGTITGGRMIARKDAPVWANLSIFGLPYPPFDYNSGMGLDDVERAEAEALGIITKRTVIKPASRPLNASVQASLPENLPPDLQAAVLNAFGKDIICAGQTAWLLPAGSAAREAAIGQQIAAGTGLMQEVIDTQADIYNALYVPEIGPIDFRWGDPQKRGVAKIVSRRDEKTALLMPEVIIRGKKHLEHGERMICEYNGYKAILEKFYKPKRRKLIPVNRWVFNGYKIDPEKAGR